LILVLLLHELIKLNPVENKTQSIKEPLVTNNISDVCETIDQVFQSKKFFVQYLIIENIIYILQINNDNFQIICRTFAKEKKIVVQ
jgi:hypothetical protein